MSEERAQATGDACSRASSGHDTAKADDGAAAVTGSRGSDSPPASARARRSRLPVVLALVVLMPVVVAVAGALVWQHNRFQAALHALQLDATVAVERHSAAVATLDDRLSALNTTIETQRRTVDDLAARFAALPERLAELERRVDAMQGGSLDARTHWVRQEAEHYLALASAQLQLAGNWEAAVRALELADDRLRQLADPGLGVVRDRIAADLLALRAVDRPDIEGIVRMLAGLAARIDELPMRSGLPAVLPRDTVAQDDAEPGLQRLWDSLQRAARGMFSIERRDPPVDRALSAEERLLVRRQLGVALERARLAAAQQQQATFDDGLRSAGTLLAQEFDTAAQPVASALEMLERLGAVAVAPERPDISESLALLRRLSPGDR